MDIACNNMEMVINDASQFRKEDAVRKKAEDLLSDLNELKEVSGKNHGIHAVGRQMMLESCELPIPGAVEGEWRGLMEFKQVA